MSASRWRAIAQDVIREVIAKVGREDEKALRKAIRDAYPFGARSNHPYKIWCDEVRRQIGYRAKDQGDLFAQGDEDPVEKLREGKK